MIYIMAHKAFDVPALLGYAPLQVGAALHEDLGWLRDDSGDNISAKNPYFCELTGLYWVWKNRGDDVKGLVHYRRYFTRTRFSGRNSAIRSARAVERRLRRADVVLPIPYHLPMNMHEQCVPEVLPERYFQLLRESVARRCPAYLPEFDGFFRGDRGCFLNMLAARREVFDAYCAWLFDVLFDLEARMREAYPEDDPQRLYGHLAERLLNVYFLHNHNLRRAYLPTANLEFTLSEQWVWFRRSYQGHIFSILWRFYLQFLEPGKWKRRLARWRRQLRRK